MIILKSGIFISFSDFISLNTERKSEGISKEKLAIEDQFKIIIK